MNRPPRIFIRATTRADRHHLLEAVKAAIGTAGGWVLDFRLFSNLAVSLAFELPARNWPLLTDQFARLDWQFEVQPLPIDPATAPELAVALHLTFIHDEGDLRRPVPAIPG